MPVIYFNAVTCNLTELTAKSACVLVVVSGVFDMYIHKDSMRSWTETC